MRPRDLFFKLHYLLGLTAGAVILLLGATGAIMAFEQEIERATHPHLFYVTPAGAPLTIAQIGAIVARAYPRDTITGYLIPTRPGLSDQVGLTRSAVFVDEYRGTILGADSGNGGWLNTVHQLHTHLLIPRPSRIGDKITTGAAWVMLVMLLSGLYLWWPAKRITLSWRGNTRRTWFDLHNVSGIFAWAFLLLATITGVTIGMENVTTPLFYRLTGSTPSHRPSLRVTHAAGATPIGLDSAFALARAALPGAQPFEIDVPEANEAYFIRARYPEDRTPGGRSQVVIDPYTGRVLFAEGSRTAPAGARMVIANRAIHTGDIYGIPSKVVMSLASVMAVVQVITGLLMWLKRRERT